MKKVKHALMRIDVPAEMLEGLEEYAAGHGMTYITVTSRMVKWLARQPDDIQTLTLAVHPDDSQKIAAQVLKHIASKA